MTHDLLFDISLPIHPGMITYPGNPEVRFSRVNGHTSILTEITIGSHTGTHVDAPSHVFPDGKTIDHIPLEHFIGPCRVIDFTNIATSVIGVTDLEPLHIATGERVLFKTANSARGFDVFHDDYVSLDGDAAEYLAKCGVSLVGIDALSIKQRGNADVRAHTSLLSRAVPILEGIDLSKIEAGDYYLFAAPLRTSALDGAPARAVLMRRSDQTVTNTP